MHSTTTTTKMSTTSITNTETTSSPDDNVDVVTHLKEVQHHIQNTILESNREENSVRLVAVSKTKPIEMIIKLYEAGQRHFGENYVQELISKAKVLSESPTYKDIQWHYIGPLQSNKAASLVKSVYPNLFCIETVSSLKVATKLNRAMEEIQQDDDGESSSKLNIYIQVNTSGEESKSGIAPTEIEVYSFLQEIQNTCPKLNILGLMTIGAPGETFDFQILNDIGTFLMKEKGVSEDHLELSMGMSNDYKKAIEAGSTNVRVGSTIFGARDYPAKK